jgi:hypothetical protein
LLDVKKNIIIMLTAKRSFVICTLRQAELEDEVEEDEMNTECSTKRREENAYRLLVGKPGGKRPL